MSTIDKSTVESFREQFFENGYIVIPQHLDANGVAEIREDVHSVLTEAFRVSGALMPGSSNEAYLDLKNRNPDLKGRAYDVMGSLQCVRDAFAKPSLRAIARAILGSPAVLDHTQVRIDDNANDRLLPMHQEMNQMSLRNTTVWIPLQKIDSQEEGGLRIIPGSHKKGFLPHRLFAEPHDYHGVREDQFNSEDEHRLEMNAGDALMFHPLLIHGSVPNRSSNIRWTIVGRLNGLKTLRYLEKNERYYPVDRDDPVYHSYNQEFNWGQLESINPIG